jgi:WD40 repeat protein
VYTLSSNTLTKIANPSALPVNRVTGVSWSPDGEYLATIAGWSGQAGARYLIVYRYVAGTLVETLQVDNIPQGGNAIAWSPNGKYLAIMSNRVSPYLFIYKFDGSVYTKLTIAEPPTYGGYRLAWSPDGEYLAVTITVAPYSFLYRRNGDTFIRDYTFSDTTQLSDIAFSPDGMIIAMSSTASPHFKFKQAVSNTAVTAKQLPKKAQAIVSGIKRAGK